MDIFLAIFLSWFEIQVPSSYPFTGAAAIWPSNYPVTKQIIKTVPLKLSTSFKHQNIAKALLYHIYFPINAHLYGNV